MLNGKGKSEERREGEKKGEVVGGRQGCHIFLKMTHDSLQRQPRFERLHHSGLDSAFVLQAYSEKKKILVYISFVKI